MENYHKYGALGRASLADACLERAAHGDVGVCLAQRVDKKGPDGSRKISAISSQYMSG